MRHHPSTIASPGTATASSDTAEALTFRFHKLMRVFKAEEMLAKSMEKSFARLAAILEFSEQHDAPSSPDNWNNDLKMMFAIQHPDVIL